MTDEKLSTEHRATLAHLQALIAEFKYHADRSLIKTKFCPAYRAAKEHAKEMERYA